MKRETAGSKRSVTALRPSRWMYVSRNDAARLVTHAARMTGAARMTHAARAPIACYRMRPKVSLPMR
jgi:hypothetical protein